MQQEQDVNNYRHKTDIRKVIKENANHINQTKIACSCSSHQKLLFIPFMHEGKYTIYCFDQSQNWSYRLDICIQWQAVLNLAWGCLRTV